MRLSTPSILTLVAGVFYLIGGAVVVALAGSMNSLLSGSGSLFGGIPFYSSSAASSSLSGAGLTSLVYALGAFGVVSGLLIMLGGVMFSSPRVERRKLAFALVLIMLLLGGIATVGGLVIGFFIGIVGLYMAWGTWPHGQGIGVAMTPMGPMPVMSGGASTTTRSGPLNYCTKCGSKLRGDEIFCGACGQRVT